MVFFLGNRHACWAHGLVTCVSGPPLRESLEQRYLDEEDPA